MPGSVNYPPPTEVSYRNIESDRDQQKKTLTKTSRLMTQNSMEVRLNQQRIHASGGSTTWLGVKAAASQSSKGPVNTTGSSTNSGLMYAR